MMGMVFDFVKAALPWVIIGLFFAYFFVYSREVREENQDAAEKSENSQKKTMSFAMPGGLLFGLAVGEALAMTQILDKNLCISLSMLIGLWIGMVLDRKNKHSDEH